MFQRIANTKRPSVLQTLRAEAQPVELHLEGRQVRVPTYKTKLGIVRKGYVRNDPRGGPCPRTTRMLGRKPKLRWTYTPMSIKTFKTLLSKEQNKAIREVYSEQMRLYKKGLLRSYVGKGKTGPVVTNPKQAYAIAKRMQAAFIKKMAYNLDVNVDIYAAPANSFANALVSVMTGKQTMDQAVDVLVRDAVALHNTP